MTFEFDIARVPAWAWAFAGTGILWIIKAWADKRYEAFKTPQTRQQIEDDERSLTNRILHSDQFKEAADHQVNITMMSEKFYGSVEDVFTRSMKIAQNIDTRIAQGISANVGGKIDAISDTQRVLLKVVEEVRKMAEDMRVSQESIRVSQEALRDKVEQHIRAGD